MSALLQNPRVAMLPWGLLFEDFLDPIGVSLERFCAEMTGSWIFGYAKAFQAVGIETVIILVSAKIDAPIRHQHTPSGATICVLPSPRIYRILRRFIANPYSRSTKRTFNIRGASHLLYPLLVLVKEVAPYLATPIRALTREIRREQCDAMLCQEYEYPRFDVCVATGRRIGVPVFAIFQGGTTQLGFLEQFVRPFTIRGSSGLIIGTRLEQHRVKEKYKISDKQVARIFNPVTLLASRRPSREEARRRLGIPIEANVAVWHGRIDMWRKGIDVLLTAWKLLCAKRPDVDLRLLLVGSGQDAEILRVELQSTDLRGVFWLDRFVHDRCLLQDYLSAADVYVFPSRKEGFPVAPLEALASGLPVVAADADGVADIFECNEYDGGLVVPRDNPVALAGALDRIFSDPELRRQLAVRGKMRSEAFSPGAVGEQLRNLLIKKRTLT